MAITDIRRDRQILPAANKRVTASGRQRGRHRRPHTWRVARLADLPRRASSLGAPWYPVACGAAIFGCVFLVLADPRRRGAR
jgi:hypothetical protein